MHNSIRYYNMLYTPTTRNECCTQLINETKKTCIYQFYPVVNQKQKTLFILYFYLFIYLFDEYKKAVEFPYDSVRDWQLIALLISVFVFFSSGNFF